MVLRAQSMLHQMTALSWRVKLVFWWRWCNPSHTVKGEFFQKGFFFTAIDFVCTINNFYHKWTSHLLTLQDENRFSKAVCAYLYMPQGSSSRNVAYILELLELEVIDFQLIMVVTSRLRLAGIIWAHTSVTHNPSSLFLILICSLSHLTLCSVPYPFLCLINAQALISDESSAYLEPMF